MIWMLIAFALSALGIALLLWFRVFISVKFDSAGRTLRVSSVWFWMDSDLSARITYGRVLGIPFGGGGNSIKPQSDKSLKQAAIRIGSRKSDSQREQKRRRGNSVLLRDWSLIGTILRRGLRGVKRLFKAFRLERWQSHLTIATPDPMITAMVYGSLTPLLALNAMPKTCLTIQPDFTAAKPQLYFDGAFSFRPLTLIWVLAATMIGMPWIRIIKSYREQRRRSDD